MPRTVRDAKLETRAARDRLRTGQTPHFKTLVPGKLHLGYRRKKKDLPGQWLVRHYLGSERYHVAPLGLADDFQDAVDDADVLTFADAQRAALGHKQARQRRGKGKTVAEAIKDYVVDVRTERPATADDAEQTANQLILPMLGRIKLTDLTTEDITDWRNALAKQGARLRTKPGEKQKLVDPKCAVTNSDYDAIESALMESSRGRWFLSEYARRIRYTDTDLLLSAIYNSVAYLANQIGGPPASQPSQAVSNVADVCCNNKLDDTDQHGPQTRSHEEFVSRY